jgi:hypothetical protein
MAGPNTAQVLTIVADQMKALTDRLDRDREDRKEADRDILANRAAVSRALLELGHSHADNAARLDRMEPVVAMVSSAKSKFAGAMVVLGLIGTLFIFGVVYFKDAILRLIFGG